MDEDRDATKLSHECPIGTLATPPTQEALPHAGFNAKAPPRTTVAFHAIVDANRAPEDAELADTLDEIAKGGRRVTAVTIPILVAAATGDFLPWLLDRKNRRVIPTWACLGATRMHRVEVPDTVRELHIFAENDEPGRAAAERTAQQHRHRRVVLRFPPEIYKDWNDWLMAQAGSAAA